jgi:hypothetical protein
LCSSADTLAIGQAVLTRTGTSQNFWLELDFVDLKQFVVRCPVHDSLRSCSSALPASVYSRLDNPDCVLAVFGQKNQTSLAHTLYSMKRRTTGAVNLHEHSKLNLAFYM